MEGYVFVINCSKAIFVLGFARDKVLFCNARGSCNSTGSNLLEALVHAIAYHTLSNVVKA